ncbi:MAG: PIG-L deacetylase family protein, partial [Candidatus Thorarchaeota archaeon]
MLIPKGKTILLVEPHPDDIFLGMYCFGKNWLFGHDPYLIQLTRGEFDFATKEINYSKAKIREEETSKFAEEVGISATRIIRWDLGDGRISEGAVVHYFDCWLASQGLTPDDCIVFVPSIFDQHDDHKFASLAIRQFKWHQLYQY